MAIVEHAYYPSFGYQCNLFYAISSRFGTPTDFMVVNEPFFDRRDWSMPAMPPDYSWSWILFRDMRLPTLRTESTNLMEATISTLRLEKQAIIRNGARNASIIENGKFSLIRREWVVGHSIPLGPVIVFRGGLSHWWVPIRCSHLDHLQRPCDYTWIYRQLRGVLWVL